MLLYCNNQSAIAVAKNNQYHACTKHIDICYHFIHKTVTHGIVKIRYFPTNQMISDIFMKALPMKHFEALHELLGIHLNWGRVLVFAMWVHILRLPEWLNRHLGAGNQPLQNICTSIGQSCSHFYLFVVSIFLSLCASSGSHSLVPRSRHCVRDTVMFDWTLY